ncbi:MULTISPECIES: hypothetical protein [Methylomonas]|uniref:hypothetical protein n=1 Tax=Methylomonas TaxID=416 RepID=UPI0012327114|nr:hypothetical protein [Methylomonas rhizoryzae]
MPTSNQNASLDDRKNIVSIRLSNEDRIAVRSTAARLMVRESKLYRFAVHHLLERLHPLHDSNFSGSDLLMLFLEFKDELAEHLELKKHQLFKIFNGRITEPHKFVAMADIELLLIPDHAVRQRLASMPDAQAFKHTDTGIWLRDYFCAKYPNQAWREISMQAEPNE